MTPEVGPAFHPDTTLIQKLIDENRGPNLFLAYAVGEEPVILHQPLSDTENLSGPYRVVAELVPPIVLTEPVELAPETFRVHYSFTGAAPFDSLTMLPTGNSSEFAANIPGQGTVGAVSYYFSAADRNGRVGHAPRPASEGELYRFHVGEDLLPPALSHRPLSNQSLMRRSYEFRAQASDNSGLASVQIFYRWNSGRLDSLQMQESESPNHYLVRLEPRGAEVGDEFEYYLIARDISRNANQARLPESGYFQFEITSTLLIDFESDDGGLVSQRPSDWEWGAPQSGPSAAFSGDNVWATRLSENYSDDSDSKLDLPPLNLDGVSNPTLTFWHWYKMEYSENTFWDGGNVKISMEGGPFEIIEPDGGYDGIVSSPQPTNVLIGEPVFGGPESNGDFWQQETFDLSAFADKTVVIRFHFGSDAGVTEPGWYIDDVEVTLTTAVAGNDGSGERPVAFRLSQNHPNPFHHETAIEYEVLGNSKHEIELVIYNVLGQQVKLLSRGNQSAGKYLARWLGDDEIGLAVPAGVYFVQLKAGEVRMVRKVLLVK